MNALAITSESNYGDFVHVAVLIFKEDNADMTTDANICWTRIVKLFTLG